MKNPLRSLTQFLFGKPVEVPEPKRKTPTEHLSNLREAAQKQEKMAKTIVSGKSLREMLEDEAHPHAS